MTITDEGASSVLLTGEGPALDSPPEVDRGRGRLLWLGLALLVLAIILGLGWWRSNPTTFGAAGDQFTLRAQANTPAYVSMTGVFPQTEELPRVKLIAGSARTQIFGSAQVEVLQCAGQAIGIVSAEAYDSACFPTGANQWSEPSMWDQVVIKVTPESPGTIVVVEGIDLTYSTGLQRGTEFTGPSGVIVFPTETG